MKWKVSFDSFPWSTIRNDARFRCERIKSLAVMICTSRDERKGESEGFTPCGCHTVTPRLRTNELQAVREEEEEEEEEEERSPGAAAPHHNGSFKSAPVSQGP
ncbi:hypothetical protein EYF80_048823 [Liparis tanakae]|uniref:Uncharacterized protein n=1 Tax=Liparis tanakae TaxID=230148 RepID=A0A4Z2FII5_9TELE|nr:hypothetical protein EYF80_048823 [Liparis tanakae]